GVLSSGGGRDFGAFLGMLAELGYGFAYRVLDAQHFGVPQRRRRVFVVGHLGDWRRAAAVLFERHSLSGHSAPGRATGEGIAAPLASGSPGSGGYRNDADTADNLISATVSAKWAKGTGGPAGDEHYNMIAHTLRGEGFDASEDGTGRGTPLVPAAFDWRAGGDTACGTSLDGVPPVRTLDTLAVAFHENQRAELTTSHTAGSLKVGGGKPGQGYPSVMYGMQVRRLTPRECERLQGMPEDHTLGPFRGKPMADGPRYRMIGNSMAVPCISWLGRRIQLVNDITRAHATGLDAS
ncbi:DNA cytosine methyltransferase, partial [Immundisolibacter sp.]|uniref:DNA cytosine methyltransferase n=1 Tax=Immundisolibacter sp. TaxID=1934948 RepID=UPI003F85C77A